MRRMSKAYGLRETVGRQRRQKVVRRRAGNATQEQDWGDKATTYR